MPAPQNKNVMNKTVCPQKVGFENSPTRDNSIDEIQQNSPESDNVSFYHIFQKLIF